MSITCVESDLNIYDSIVIKCVYATIDPKTVDASPLPSDYKFEKCCLPKHFAQIADRLHNFKVRSDDVWLVGHYKSGTTWMHNIIWQLKNNLDFSAPAITHVHQVLERVLFLGNDFEKRSDNDQNIIYDLDREFDREIDEFDNLPSPRILKSHLPAHLLPKELWTVRPKIIYIARNPKDIAVSTYHFSKVLGDFPQTKESLFDQIISERIYYGPLHDHVLSFWQLRHLDHVLFVMYEELLADQFNGVKRVSEFLNCSYSDLQLRNLSEHVSFDKMKGKIPLVSIDGKTGNESVHRFCRKGEAGNYRDEMSDEYIKRFDEWTAERLKNTNFQYANV